jgi:c-di-GMP-related signal transduction protein
MRTEIYSYEQLCQMYGQHIIDPLETYEYWQLQTTGQILFQGTPYDLPEWLAIKRFKDIFVKSCPKIREIIS